MELLNFLSLLKQSSPANDSKGHLINFDTAAIAIRTDKLITEYEVIDPLLNYRGKANE